MGILIRLILRPLLRSRVGMFILGAILIVIGLILGASSSQVSYTSSTDGTAYQANIGQQSGNVYIHADGSNDYYVAFSSDFKVSQSDFDKSSSVSFIARSDTSTLDPALKTASGTINDAHKIEKLVLKDSSHNVIATFTTDEYNANPNGVYANNWPGGAICIGLGVLLAILGFVIYRKKPQVAPAAPMGGFQQPMYPQANPYPGQAPVGQPQANPYAQPYPGQPPVGQPQANPYQYPPQQ